MPSGRTRDLPPPALESDPVEVGCGFCGARAANLEKLERGFRIVSCRVCAHRYVSPRPSSDALLRDYQEYLPDDPAGIEAWRAMMEVCETAAQALLLERAPPPARLLDIGCGYGFFLSRMRECGYDVQGLEVARTGLSFARARLGIDAREALLDGEPFPAGSFDVVTAFYVIEHVPDPLDFLRRARALLRPGGLVLLRYPDSIPVARLLRAIGLDSVPIYDAPFHLSAFSPASIARFLERAGFERIEHAIGGHTRPPRQPERFISTVCGRAAALFERATLGRILLPGVSKCCLARRPK